jgi:hypothetical protein
MTTKHSMIVKKCEHIINVVVGRTDFLVLSGEVVLNNGGSRKPAVLTFGNDSGLVGHPAGIFPPREANDPVTIKVVATEEGRFRLASEFFSKSKMNDVSITFETAQDFTDQFVGGMRIESLQVRVNHGFA